jgi:hypothetical protein
VKYPDVVESSSVKETKTLPLYLHGLQRNHLHLHPVHTPFSHDSHSYVRNPIHSIVHICCIHQYKSKSLVTQLLLLWDLSFSGVHLLTYGLLHPHTFESFRKQVVFLSSRFHDHENLSICFYGLFYLSQLRYQADLYVLQQYRLHQTQLILEGLLEAFFLQFLHEVEKSSDVHRCCSSPIPWQSAH